MSDPTFSDATGGSDAVTPASAPLDVAAGSIAEHNIYVIHGSYRDVPDIDGSLVQIEDNYPSDVYATELKAGERGNLLVAAGSEVTPEVAARLAQ